MFLCNNVGVIFFFFFLSACVPWHTVHENRALEKLWNMWKIILQGQNFSVWQVAFKFKKKNMCDFFFPFIDWMPNTVAYILVD